MKKIYNLTTHICPSDKVEMEPRLPPLKNPKDGREVIKNVKEALLKIPRGSSILVGGHPNYTLVLSWMAKDIRAKIYLWDRQREIPYTAAFPSRSDRFEVELGSAKQGGLTGA